MKHCSTSWLELSLIPHDDAEWEHLELMQDGNVSMRSVSIDQEIPIEKYVVDRSKQVHLTDFDESR